MPVALGLTRGADSEGSGLVESLFIGDTFIGFLT